MQFSILSWNIHGRRHVTKTRFDKIAPALQDLHADVVCLQEAHEAREKLQQMESFRAYHRVVPGRKGFNHNIILSRFPVLHHGEMHFSRFTKRRIEAALWADILVSNRSEILKSLTAHEQSVSHLKKALSARNLRAIERFINEANSVSKKLAPKIA